LALDGVRFFLSGSGRCIPKGKAPGGCYVSWPKTQNPWIPKISLSLYLPCLLSWYFISNLIDVYKVAMLRDMTPYTCRQVIKLHGHRKRINSLHARHKIRGRSGVLVALILNIGCALG
jgi:preprotein translocase subunit Sec63